MKPQKIRINNHWWRAHYQIGAQVRCELRHKDYLQKGIGIAEMQQDALKNAIDNLKEKLKGMHHRD